MTRKADPPLRDALAKAYAARAKLFHECVRSSEIDLLIAEIDEIHGDNLNWTDRSLGVSAVALDRVREAGARPHQVFAHPEILSVRPYLIAYYRNIVALSKKGIGQLYASVERFESRRASQMDGERALRLCAALNTIISEVIEDVEAYSLDTSRHVAFAEIGTEIQGRWANLVGRGASTAVEELIDEYLRETGLGSASGRRRYFLANGWEIRFGSEPDVAFFDSHGTLWIAIEIKGSLDVAGAQTRYGEAKKSFAKAIAANPRCHTIYLASCFTEAVIQQIRDDGQVRDWFNLTSILYDSQERRRFLDKVFHIVQTPS